MGALEAALGDQAVAGPLRGVAPLEPAAPVLRQPRVDQLREGPGRGRPRCPADRRGPLGEVRLPQALPRRGPGDPGVPGRSRRRSPRSFRAFWYRRPWPRRPFPLRPPIVAAEAAATVGRTGWSACPRPDPKPFRAHSRKNAAPKPARQRLSNTASAPPEPLVGRALRHAGVVGHARPPRAAERPAVAAAVAAPRPRPQAQGTQPPAPRRRSPARRSAPAATSRSGASPPRVFDSLEVAGLSVGQFRV